MDTYSNCDGSCIAAADKSAISSSLPLGILYKICYFNMLLKSLNIDPNEPDSMASV